MIDNDIPNEPAAPQESAKPAWIAPVVTKVLAGSAEGAGARGDDHDEAGTS